MSGKQTFKTPRPSILVEGTNPCNLTDEQVKNLKIFLARELTKDELTHIKNKCESVRDWAKLVENERPKSQDILKTLEAISKEPNPLIALAKYRCADGWTQAEIYTSAYFKIDAKKLAENYPVMSTARASIEFWDYDRSTIIPLVVAPAAKLASERLKAKNAKNGKRPTIGVQELTDWAVRFWEECGGKGRFYVKTDGTNSPALNWVKEILTIAFVQSSKDKSPDARGLLSRIKTGTHRKKK